MSIGIPQANIALPENPEAELFENHALKLKDEDLNRISAELMQGIENDKRSLEKINKIRKDIDKLYSLIPEQKRGKGKNRSSVKVPVITTSVVNLAARSSIDMFEDGRIITGIPIDNSRTSREAAKRVEKHMNYQIDFQDENFKDGFKKTILMFFKYGYSFRKTFYDSQRKQVISDYILPENLIINYYTKNLDLAPRITQVLKMTEDEIRLKIKNKIYKKYDDLHFMPEKPEETPSTENKRDLGQEIPEVDYTTPIDVYECHTGIQLKKGDFRTPCIVTIDKSSGYILRIIKRVDPNTKKPLNFFTAYNSGSNEYSIYGQGIGVMLYAINHTMNTIINQMNDAATASNNPMGFINKTSGIKKGQLEFDVGEIKEVNSTSGDLSKDFFQLITPPPSGISLSLLQTLNQYAEKLSTVSDPFVGQLKSDTTATAASLVHQQSQMWLTSKQKILLDTFNKELKLRAVFNSIFLDPVEYFDINTKDNDIESQLELSSIGRDDYLRTYQVVLSADPKKTRRQENVAKAEYTAQLVNQSPILAQDPITQADLLRMRLEAADIDEAVITNLEKRMGEILTDQAVQKEAEIQQVEAESDIQQQELNEQELALAEQGALQQV